MITWTRPARPAWMSPEEYDRIPPTLTLRELRFDVIVPGRRTEMNTVVTSLTPREREVMELFAAAETPKRIAFKLGLSRKTVDVHRNHIMMKMRVDSLVELVQLLE